MTRRSLLLVAGFALGLTGLVHAAAQEPPPVPLPPIPPTAPPAVPVAPTVQVSGSVREPGLLSSAPADGVIVTQKGWVGLAQAWNIPNPAKFDSTKEFLVVGTTQAGKMVLNAKLDAAGDLRVSVEDNGDTQPGFRFGVRSVPRTGVKTVNGKALPLE